jgi:glycerol uptake facilitator protein
MLEAPCAALPGPSLGRRLAGEFVGTFILAFFGVGVVHAAVLCGAQAGIWQVAVVWGAAVSLAIYAVGTISGAHLNPAITIMLAVLERCRYPHRAALYIVVQVAGAFAAAAVLNVLFAGPLEHFERTNGIVRGQAGSELSGMVYGEYFPNPMAAKAHGWPPDVVTQTQAMLAEGIGTAFLAFFVLAVTDRRRAGRPMRGAPVLIGVGVAMVISVVAPLSQAGLNPARDFGPRLFAALAGWGGVAIPGPRDGFFTVYILAPILGALVGAAAWRLVARPGDTTTEAQRSRRQKGREQNTDEHR